MTETGVGPVGSDLAWRGHESSFSGQPLAASFPTTCKTSESQGGPWARPRCCPQAAALSQGPGGVMSLFVHFGAGQPPGTHRRGRFQKSDPVPTLRLNFPPKGRGRGGKLELSPAPPSPSALCRG